MKVKLNIQNRNIVNPRNVQYIAGKALTASAAGDSPVPAESLQNKRQHEQFCQRNHKELQERRRFLRSPRFEVDYPLDARFRKETNTINNESIIVCGQSGKDLLQPDGVHPLMSFSVGNRYDRNGQLICVQKKPPDTKKSSTPIRLNIWPIVKAPFWLVWFLVRTLIESEEARRAQQTMSLWWQNRYFRKIRK